MDTIKTMTFCQPTPADILFRLKTRNPSHAHPRLLLDKHKVLQLRSRVRSEQPYKDWMAGVTGKAEQYLDKADTLKYELRDGVRLLYVSREALEYIENLGFAWQMTGDMRYAEAVKSILLKVCGEDFPDWHPYHFLDTAEMAAAVALGYDWCYSALTAQERKLVRRALVKNALIPVMEDYNEVTGRERTWLWSSSSSEHYPNNWTAVCFGGTALAALSIGDENLGSFTGAGNVICEGLARLCDWLEKHLPDGVCPDGTAYWEYSMAYMALGLNAMETALGTDYGISDHPVFDLTFQWLTQMMGPAGAFNLDCNNANFVNSPEYFWHSAKRRNAALTQFRLRNHIGSWGFVPTWKDILWYEPVEGGAAASIPKESNLSGVWNVAILRSGFEKDDTFVGMLCGNTDKNISSYEEEGSFVLDMLGQRWVLDLGPEWQHYVNFEVPWNHYYRVRAEGHNTVVVNPDGKHEYDIEGCGRIVKFEANEAASLCVADLSALVQTKGVDHWSRELRLDKQTGSVTVGDTLESESPFEYYWFAHTDGQIYLEESGRTAILSKNGKEISVELHCADASLRFTVMEASPLPVSPNPKQADNRGVQKLALHQMGASRTRIAVEFIPQGKE